MPARESFALGKELCNGASLPPAVYVFLSHTHIDHVLGLCFFEPLLTASGRTFIFGSRCTHGELTRSLRHLTNSHLFPVSLDELKGKKEIFSLAGGEVIYFGSAGRRPKIEPSRVMNGVQFSELMITTYKSPAHPLNGVMLYRVHYQNKSFVYATDIEAAGRRLSGDHRIHTRRRLVDSRRPVSAGRICFAGQTKKRLGSQHRRLGRRSSAESRRQTACAISS